jgi:hypothetical protein
MSQSSSASQSGNVIFGDESPSWIMPAILIGGLVLLALAWLVSQKGK